ncbi:unnamed protein product [Amoebophrya sp. A25]|nr:unnamed protein product [Amoebophrya sp. A25]|eukprot:GSA25T00006805001.1
MSFAAIHESLVHLQWSKGMMPPRSDEQMAPDYRSLPDYSPSTTLSLTGFSPSSSSSSSSRRIRGIPRSCTTLLKARGRSTTSTTSFLPSLLSNGGVIASGNVAPQPSFPQSSPDPPAAPPLDWFSPTKAAPITPTSLSLVPLPGAASSRKLKAMVEAQHQAEHSKWEWRRKAAVGVVLGYAAGVHVVVGTIADLLFDTFNYASHYVASVRELQRKIAKVEARKRRELKAEKQRMKEQTDEGEAFQATEDDEDSGEGEDDSEDDGDESPGKRKKGKRRKKGKGKKGKGKSPHRGKEGGGGSPKEGKKGGPKKGKKGSPGKKGKGKRKKGSDSDSSED